MANYLLDLRMITIVRQRHGNRLSKSVTGIVNEQAATARQKTSRMVCEVENRSQRRKKRSIAHSGQKKIPLVTKYHYGRGSHFIEDGGEILESHYRW